MSWGEVNKKGLICQCQKCKSNERERGYWFGNGLVRERYFKDERDLINTYDTLEVENRKKKNRFGDRNNLIHCSQSLRHS